MANIMDYLDWRGDLTFDQSEFNEVDNLILAQLSYVDFASIVPGMDSSETVAIKDASALFFSLHDEKEIMESSSLTKMSAFVLKKMAQGRRFEKTRLSKYVNSIDLVAEKQFSAINYELEDGTIYVAYRGTDDTLVGWKEDFNMSFMTPVPSQIDAVKYLDECIADSDKKIRIGGHSKGGNLAVYAAVYCRSCIKDNITAVYNNDGPGFSKAIICSKEYQEMLCSITTIIPQSSVVGLLLEHEEDYCIVKSSQNGMMQHDALSWEVLGKHFVCVNAISRRSRILEAALKAWVSKLEEPQREQFVDSLFDIFDAANIKNLADLTHDKWKKVIEIVKEISTMPPENKQVLSKTIRLLLKESNRVYKSWRTQNSQV